MTLRIVGGVGGALFVAAAFTPLPNVLGAWLSLPSPLGRAGAIVVLGGGGIEADGTLTDTSLKGTVRTETAAGRIGRGIGPPTNPVAVHMQQV